MKSNKKLEVAGAGVIAAIVIACGDAAMSGGAGMLNDAGEMLVDAGQMMMDGGEPIHDAGEVIRDAGMVMMDAAEALDDASDTVRDSALDSATAQSCGSCTVGERQMIVTAEQDLQQLRSATVERGAWSNVVGTPFNVTPLLPTASCSQHQAHASHAELTEGPIVLTDLHTSGAAEVFSVESGAPCYEIHTRSFGTSTGCGSSPGNGSGEHFRRPSTSRTLFVVGTAQSITGARVFVPAGQTVCALVAGTPSPAPVVANPTSTAVLWSGFVPYE